MADGSQPHDAGDFNCRETERGLIEVPPPTARKKAHGPLDIVRKNPEDNTVLKCPVGMCYFT